MKWMVVVLAGCMGWVGTSTSRGETTVTLPAGVGESFTVQSVSSNPLLRADGDAVLTGTNVALGTQGSNIVFQAGNLTLGYMSTFYGAFGMFLGSNTVTASGSSTVIGHGHTMFNAPYASIWGGKENILNYGMTQGGNLSPYQSTIVGGTENKIYGTQNSAILGGARNMVTNATVYAVIAGGYDNRAMGNYSAVVGGRYNEASATNSFAAGYYARARHNGSFVWADYSTATYLNTDRDNEMLIRAAGGVRLTSSLGTNVMPSKASHYADNNIVAWGRVGKDSGLSSLEHFGVLTVTNTAQGTYVVTLDTAMTSAFQLIPMAILEVDTPPITAALARNIYIDQGTSFSNFTVYVTDGNHSLTNNDFLFMVTGR